MTGDRRPDDVRFGAFLLQGRERRLVRDGTPIALEPRSFDVLALLVAHAGSLVTKDELLARVWAGRVVEEGNLHVHISALRKLLGPEAIATVARHGYRFTIPVEAFAMPVAMPAHVVHNLPQSLTTFIGREDDLQHVTQRLAESRLVTLGGLGGSGKTRLAIEVATRVLPSFPDGVHFVDLAPVADGDRIPRAVAAALDLREQRDVPVAQQLLRHCRDRRLLLVLDNCEHVVDACATMLAPLLSASPSLRVLATSRERLGVAGEVAVPLRALTAPSAEVAPDPDALQAYESVRLFVARARQVVPDFAIGAGNAAALAEICRRLDGIPLAIELAAALVELLSVEQIRERLDDRFRLLAGSVRADPRHRTLLATLASSYACLAPGEQRFLACLAVFTGGFTLPAAAAVAGDGDEMSTLQRIGRLVDKSLVQVDRTGEAGPRYALLETVREFARAELAANGGAAAAAQRHRDFFAEFARAAQAQMMGAGIRAWIPRIDAELPNLLAACAAFASAADGAAGGLALAANLRGYWLAVGRFGDGMRFYESALARPGGDAPALARGKTLYALGQHLYAFGRLQEALAPTREALAIAREHGDDELVVYCLDRIGLASTWLGDVAAARACADDELRVATRTGNERLIGFALTAQGAACRAEGKLDAAAHAFEAALALFARGTDRHNRHNALVDVARVAVARDDFVRAREALTAAIDLVLEMGTAYRGHFALAASARLAAARAEWTRAARWQGTSDQAVDAAGGVRTWFDDRVLAALQEKPARMLGAAAHAETYAAGRALPIATALAEVVAWLRDDAAWAPAA